MLSLQISPLQLEGYYVREFHFVLRAGHDEETTKLAMQVGLHMQSVNTFNPDQITVNIVAGGAPSQEDPTRFAAILELTTKNAPEIRFPYDFKIVLVGYFKLNLPQPAEITEELEKGLKISATSILYAAAREYIAGATGRGPFPAAILPSVVIGFSDEEGGKQNTETRTIAGGKVPRKTARKGASKKKRR